MVYAERALFPGHQPIVANEHFRPELLQRGQSLDSLTDATKAVLVKNGTLNPDHTFNEETARRAAWKLAPVPAGTGREPKIP